MRAFIRRKASLKGSGSAELKAAGSAECSGDDSDDFHDTAEAQLHPDAHEEGGFGFTNKELLARQRGVITEVIKEMGKKLLSGQLNLVNISLPVKMFEPRSYLEKLTDVWVHPRFLRAAAEASDPVVRLQHTITWFVAGLQHVYQSWRKPFNPILGETFQARLSDGSAVHLEQISHHPPVSAFQLDGPEGLYQFRGVSQPDVSFELKANSVRTVARGERQILFKDGTEVLLEYPTYYMRGLLYTAMPRGDMAGAALFLDRAHGLLGEVLFGKVPGREGEPLLQRPDSISVSIHEVTLAEQPRAASPPGSRRRSLTGLASSLLYRGGGEQQQPSLAAGAVKGRLRLAGCGNWLSHLDWDGERCWTLAEDPPAQWGPVENPLPSDARFREDLRALQGGDLAKAQAAKEALEQRQREDAKLRKPPAEGLGLGSSFQRSGSLGR